MADKVAVLVALGFPVVVFLGFWISNYRSWTRARRASAKRGAPTTRGVGRAP